MKEQTTNYLKAKAKSCGITTLNDLTFLRGLALFINDFLALFISLPSKIPYKF